MGAKRRRKSTGCPHPPARLHAWDARDDRAPKGRVFVVACCDCGAVLKGGCSADEKQVKP